MKMSETLGKAVETLTYNTEYPWPMKRCLIGLEFEFENPRGAEITPKDKRDLHWYTIKPDGSLRDNGLEFVLARPLFGDDLRDSIVAMCELAKEYKFVCNYRTGLHVHLDVRDMEQEQLRLMLILYTMYEKAIFRFVGKNRWDSNFAIPWSRHCSQLQEASKILDPAVDIRLAPNIAAKLDRYSALNLNSLNLFGSVEWRQPENTTDVDWIMRWVALIQKFKLAAVTMRMTEHDLLARFSVLGARRFTSFCGFSDDLFPEEGELWDSLVLAHELVQQKVESTWEDSLLKGYRNRSND